LNRMMGRPCDACRKMARSGSRRTYGRKSALPRSEECRIAGTTGGKIRRRDLKDRRASVCVQRDTSQGCRGRPDKAGSLPRREACIPMTSIPTIGSPVLKFPRFTPPAPSKRPSSASGRRGRL
jgi:hypothetical protein